MNCSPKERDELREKMLGIMKADDVKSMSMAIEKLLKIDVPAPWKAYGMMKIGEGTLRGHLAHLIHEAPDEVPGPILKQLLMLAIMTGG
jgi:hypothetical protein